MRSCFYISKSRISDGFSIAGIISLHFGLNIDCSPGKFGFDGHLRVPFPRMFVGKEGADAFFIRRFHISWPDIVFWLIFHLSRPPERVKVRL